MTVDVRKSLTSREGRTAPATLTARAHYDAAVASLAPPPTRRPAGAERSFSVPLGLIKTPRVCLLSKDNLPAYTAIKYA